MGQFDDIILKTTVTDEADRVALQALATKYPALRTDVDDKADGLDKWHKWKADNWDGSLGTTRQHAATVTELEAARLRIQAMEAAGIGGDMKFEDIERELTAKGYVRKDDLEAAADPMVVQRVNRSAAGIEQFYMATSTIPVEHYKEFGNIDPTLMPNLVKAYGEERKLNPNADPRVVYDRMVAEPLRQRRSGSPQRPANKAATELGNRRGRGAWRGAPRQELGMSSGSPGMPVDTGGSPSMDIRNQRINAAETTGQAKTAEALKTQLGSAASVNAGLAWLQEHRAGSVQ